MRNRYPPPTEEQYNLCTRAANTAGLIKDIYPYEQLSIVMSKARMSFAGDSEPRGDWYQLLGSGLEDAYVPLLLSILPNLSNILFRGVPTDPKYTLPWPRTAHGFKSTRRFAIGATDG